MESLLERHGFDGVVNLAAQAGVRYSIENPLAYVDSNLVGFAHILEGCRHNSVKLSLSPPAAASRSIVEIDIDDLLPGAKRKAAINKRHGKRWSKKSGPNVTMSVAIPPARVVRVMPSWIYDFIKQALKIADAARFVFECRQGAGR